MYVGCHISIRKGFLAAAQTAAAIGGNAFQYFPKNPRSLSIKEWDKADAEACSNFCKANDIRSIAHTTYATNLAVTGSLREPTIQSVKNDLSIADSCGSIGLVVHFGKFKEKNPLIGYRNIISALNEILADYSGEALILLENQAGESGKVGSTLEELTQIRGLSDYPDKIGFCLDTCHIFASGVWTLENGEELKAKGKELGYFEHLKAVHLNDSKHPCGSLRDRHENIGKGYIGENGFQRLCIPSEVLRELPIVLETPVPEEYTHGQEIAYVRKLLGGE
ncbi:deoxyribonuclease IV [Paenibacillus turpanensis]|uniref:deoxyribonuclease IV n=1 Tax=Paenibacillus turpanensis TaxID=2689078 RepID=UPI00140C403D|nr:deoxyribonuclease IV [Paenibacillus turpanensis]